MFDALIFDFDGLMVDTEMPAFESWQELFAEHGCELDLTEWAVCLGGSGREIDTCAILERELGRAVDRPALRARRAQRKTEMVAELPLLAGVQEYVLEARCLGMKAGVASSSSQARVRGHLARLGLGDAFDCIVTADDVAQVKPDPEIYLSAAARLGVLPIRALALEDSPNGITAAKAAGMKCVAVPNGLTGQLDLSHADLRIESLMVISLSALIDKLGERAMSRST